MLHEGNIVILFIPDAQKIVMSSLLTFIYMHDIVDGFSMCMFLRIYMYNPNSGNYSTKDRTQHIHSAAS